MGTYRAQVIPGQWLSCRWGLYAWFLGDTGSLDLECVMAAQCVVCTCTNGPHGSRTTCVTAQQVVTEKEKIGL